MASLAVLMLGACSGMSDDMSGAEAGLRCVDDSPGCIAARSRSLQAYRSDPTRAFVHQPASAAAYASGVRLFAFKSRKGELTCEELEIGRREAEAAGPTLRGPSGSGLTQAQIARGAMLGTEVARELRQEEARRCRV